MLIYRYCVIALCLAVSSLAHGQATPPTSDVVVTGTTEKMSDWKRADAPHVVVYSSGSEAELFRVTRNIERLHALMSRLYRRGDGAGADPALPLQVTLSDSASRFAALDLGGARVGEGPYRANFAGQRYYDPRDDGAVLVVARTDQIIDLNTRRRFNNDCDDLRADTGSPETCSKLVPYHDPVPRSWEASLYAAFAQHFLQTYRPAAYPGWYVDGLGALFSTFVVRGDGGLDYATPPPGFRQIFKSYGAVNVGDVLTGRYLAADAPRGTIWTPYHAWLLTHYFVFSKLGPERSAQFMRYMTAIRQGMPMAEAAAAFGDLRKLQRDIVRYGERPTAFARADPPPPSPGSDPLVSRLTMRSAVLVEARLEAGAERTGTISDDRVATLRARIAPAGDGIDAALLMVEAECRGGRPAACLADADRVLARAPDDARALAWRGLALIDLIRSGTAPAGSIATARTTLERAIDRDGQLTLPRIAYFQSFVATGERVPENALAGMALVVRAVPAAPGPRLYLAEELVRQGQTGLARRLLNPVLYGTRDSPQRAAAERLFQAETATSAPAP